MLDPGNVAVGRPCPPGAGCVEILGQVSSEICVRRLLGKMPGKPSSGCWSPRIPPSGPYSKALCIVC